MSKSKICHRDKTASKRRNAAARSKASRGQNVTLTLSLKQLKEWVRKNPTDVSPALTLADHWNRAYDGERVLETLRPLATLYPFNSNAVCAEFDRLSAFAYCNLGRLAEAEAAVDRGIAASPEAIDFYYVLCYIRLSLSEYGAAREAGLAYLSLYERGLLAAESTSAVFSASTAHLSQLCNFIGVACKELQNAEEAANYFEKAISADVGNQMPYINLANLYLQNREHEKAKEVVERGLASGRQIQELRILAESLQNRATVSACLMVKNEEELLGRCLASIRDWVDEIIVVDTGSTDRTVEIAKSYGAKLYFHPWEGDFSKSRNYTLMYATCDWIFIIDADEEMRAEDVPTIKRVLNDPRHEYVSINVFNVYGEHEEQTTFLPSIRFFRRRLNLHYEGIVHNTLNVPAGAPVLRADVQLKHYGYGLSPEKMKQKLARSKALLEKQLAENPDNFYALFNYAQLLRGEEASQEINAPAILKSAARAVELTDPNDPGQRFVHLMCLDQLGWTYLFLEDHDKAIEYARRALALKSNYLDPLLLLGHAYARKKDWTTAIEAYKHYLTVQGAYTASDESDSLILMHVNSRAAACYSLGLIYELAGDLAQAKTYYHQTVAANRAHPEANLRLARLYISEGNVNETASCCRRHLDYAPDSEEAHAELANAEHQRRNLSEAIRHYEHVLKLNPSNSSALLRLGQIHADQGAALEASEFFKRALETGGHNPELQIQLAGIYQALGRQTEAIERYRDYLKVNQATSAILNDLGSCFFKVGDLAQAEKWFTEATQVSPVVSVAYRNLGVTLARAGRTSEAAVQFSKFLELEPDEAEIREILGDLLVHQGDYGRAIDCYEQYLRKKPSSAPVLYSLAECYRNMGHRDAALIGYRRAVQVDRDFVPARQRLEELAATAV